MKKGIHNSRNPNLLDDLKTPSDYPHSSYNALGDFTHFSTNPIYQTMAPARYGSNAYKPKLDIKAVMAILKSKGFASQDEMKKYGYIYGTATARYGDEGIQAAIKDGFIGMKYGYGKNDPTAEQFSSFFTGFPGHALGNITKRAMGGLVPGYKEGGPVKDGWLQKWARGISGQPASEMLGVAPLLRLIAGIGGKGDKLGAAMAPLSFAGMGVGPKIAGNLGKTAFAIPNKLYQLKNKAKVNSMIKSGMWHGSQPTGYRGEEYLQGTNILDGAQSNDPYYGMGFFGTSSKGEADLYASGYNSFSNWGESFGSISQIIGAPKGKYIDFTKKPGSLKWQDYSLAKALGATKNSSIFDLMPENLGSIMSSEGMTGAIMNRVNTGAVPKDIEGAKWLSWNNPAGVITKEKYANGGLVKKYAMGGLIKGPGTGTSDSITAGFGYAGGGSIRVSNGEYVVKASSVKDYGVDAMNAVNNGTATIGTNSGGTVYNINMPITSNNANPEGVANEVMRRLKLEVSKNNKSNKVGL